ncbi:MAG: response regulator transcription factor [Clostridia bacterium]|nr:response regulator transcription factor [Clostridia bacterium]
MAKIMVVEDEKAINDLIALNLRMVGHEVAQARNGKDARRLFKESAFDLLLLDVMLPDTDGFTLYRYMQTVPAIFVTALGETRNKVQGFELGADDYLVKPFEIPELLMRVNAVLRRTMKIEDRYEYGDLCVDFHGRTATKGGVPVELTAQEFSLLEILIRNRNIAVSRQQILHDAWGISFMGETRTIDVHIQRLRKKLGLDNQIKTVYKCGYRFEDRS